MIDECSLKCHKQIKESGKLGKDQAVVLEIFKRSMMNMTARQAHYAVYRQMNFNGVRSRITELTKLGLLEKAEKVLDEECGKMVNTWQICLHFQDDLFGATPITDADRARMIGQ